VGPIRKVDPLIPVFTKLGISPQGRQGRQEVIFYLSREVPGANRNPLFAKNRSFCTLGPVRHNLNLSALSLPAGGQVRLSGEPGFGNALIPEDIFFGPLNIFFDLIDELGGGFKANFIPNPLLKMDLNFIPINLPLKIQDMDL
jgi:hypothetical protein